VRTLSIPTAEVFEPLLAPSRYKGIWGGRGGAKSHFCADLLIDDALRFPSEAQEGLRAICGREIQKSLKESAKYLIESKLSKFGLGEADGFRVYTDRIATPKDGVIAFTGLQDHTTDSIKSFEGFHRLWCEEASSVSDRSIQLIKPTIRWENRRLGLASEMWFSWNPRRKNDAIDVMLRQNQMSGATVVKSNWNNNPWFPKVLEQERLDCFKNQPDQYDHIWEGGYATVVKGAYYAQSLITAKAEGRIGNVAADPLIRLRAYCDIGGVTGKSDAFAMWICQFVGREIRWLNYYESVGQELSAHVNWLHEQGYKPGKIDIYLPHDGASQRGPYSGSWETAFRDAGYDCETLFGSGSGGVGAPMVRVQAMQRLFPRMWFNDTTTAAGREAMGFYHEKWDDIRNVGLGPEHDWSSHGCDAAGTAAFHYEEPRVKKDANSKYKPKRGGGGNSWMTA
jgi:phage terminase large subunit